VGFPGVNSPVRAQRVLPKKCSVGKSCGSSCVQRIKKCEISLGKDPSQALDKMATKVEVVVLFEQAKAHRAPGFRAEFNRIGKELREELGHQIRRPEDVREFEKRIREAGLLPGGSKIGGKKSGTGIPQEEWDQATSPKDYDNKMGGVKLRREGDPKYNGWSESSSPSALEVGFGSYGTVIMNPNGEFVKRGILSEDEAKVLKKVGENDLGPRLIAADLNGKVDNSSNDPNITSIEHFGLRNGRIAMTRVKGEPLGSFAYGPDENVFYGWTSSDIYWTAMSQLHRLGVAHNDAHPGNIMVDVISGRARWVDFGMAQDSPKAALAEAIGAFAIDSQSRTRTVVQKMPSDASGHFMAGNWQTKESEVSGMRRALRAKTPDDTQALERDLPVLARVRSNNEKVRETLRNKFGLTEDEVGALYAHGIRSPIETFNQGVWQRLGDSDAKELIEIFYEGVF
jgi:hypothetical protein